jgi:cbb3-type cytochrome oxidase maturation protein
MAIITLLISISITIALVFLGVFVWSLKSGQFDDTTTPAMRMIFDDLKSRKKTPAVDQPEPAATADKNQSQS